VRKLVAKWYVQNVSTFPNTFTVISPLICVFWIQLTRSNIVFSRIALVSHFCAEIQLLGKIPENTTKILFYQKTHGARVRDGEGPGGHHTTWWCEPGLAAPRGGVAALAISSSPPSAYIYSLTWNYCEVRRFSQIEFCCAATIRNRDLEPETPFWHSAETWIWRRSSSSSSPTSLHQPSMIPPSMCE
jgi:hypothetical protein